MEIFFESINLIVLFYVYIPINVKHILNTVILIPLILPSHYSEYQVHYVVYVNTAMMTLTINTVISHSLVSELLNTRVYIQ